MTQVILYIVLLTCISLTSATAMERKTTLEKSIESYEKRLSQLHHTYTMAMLCNNSHSSSQEHTRTVFRTQAQSILTELHEAVYELERKRLVELEKLLTGTKHAYLHPLSVAVIEKKIRDEYSFEKIIARVDLH